MYRTRSNHRSIRLWVRLPAVRVEQHHEEGKADSSGHQEEPLRGVEGLEGDRGRRLRRNDVCAGEIGGPSQDRRTRGEKRGGLGFLPFYLHGLKNSYSSMCVHVTREKKGFVFAEH